MKTGNRPSPPRCALAGLMRQDMDVEEIKRRAWIDDGILVVSPDDPVLGMDEAEFIRQVGNRKYGRRVNGSQ